MLQLALEVGDQYLRRPSKLYKPTGPWVRCCGPNLADAAYMYQWTRTGSCTSCGLSGQAVTKTQPWGSPIPDEATWLTRLSRNNPPGGGGGFRIHEVYRREVKTETETQTHTGYGMPLPVGAPAVGGPVPSPNYIRGTGSAVDSPVDSSADPEMALDPARRNERQAAEAADVSPEAWSWSSRGGRYPIHSRTQPDEGTTERKVRSKFGRFMYGLFKGWDIVSEWSEMVDALYDALPKDVRDRWSAGRDGRLVLDQFGQYGIDGADWKLQAVWHNLHKIDAAEALENIAQSLLEDFVIGQIHKRLPKEVGYALSGLAAETGAAGLEERVAKWLNSLLEQAGIDPRDGEDWKGRKD